jgi:hypothetical protein
VEAEDKVVILEGLSTVSSHDEWTALSVSGQRPKPRYEVSVISHFILIVQLLFLLLILLH